jgi:hypothetical protein
MAIEISSGGVSKTYRYYPRDKFYVDASGNVNTSGNGQQVREAYFNGVKYYPEEIPNIQYICRMPYDFIENLDPTLTYYPYVKKCTYENPPSRWPDVIPNEVIRSHNYRKFLPSVLELPACTLIESGVFSGSTDAAPGLESIDIPVCTNIQSEAFSGCTRLRTVGTTSALKGVGDGAFKGCTSLSAIDTSGCTYISSHAFQGCTALESVDLSSCDKVYDDAFYRSGLKSLTFLGTKLSYGAFRWCESLEEANLPNFTKFDGTYEFLNCTAMVSINIPNLTYISGNSLAGCISLQAADFPLCTHISGEGLMDCPSLVTVNMPLAEYVGYRAFMWCSSLSSVYFPNCTSVGEEAFRECTSLSSVTVKEGCTFGRDVFYGIRPRPQVNYV